MQLLNTQRSFVCETTNLCILVTFTVHESALRRLTASGICPGRDLSEAVISCLFLEALHLLAGCPFQRTTNLIRKLAKCSSMTFINHHTANFDQQFANQSSSGESRVATLERNFHLTRFHFLDVGSLKRTVSSPRVSPGVTDNQVVSPLPSRSSAVIFLDRVLSTLAPDFHFPDPQRGAKFLTPDRTHVLAGPTNHQSPSTNNPMDDADFSDEIRPLPTDPRGNIFRMLAKRQSESDRFLCATHGRCVTRRHLFAKVTSDSAWCTCVRPLMGGFTARVFWMRRNKGHGSLHG